MILAIDCGNSRLKWGVGASPGKGELARWQDRGTLLLDEVAKLGQQLRFQAPPERVMISNVAGVVMRDQVKKQLDYLKVELEWTVASAAGWGVTNRYTDPAQLGPDRWAAMIGARNLCQENCLVVMAGTATTIDLLTQDGVFQGGVILPGVELMKNALAHSTAGLPLAEGTVIPTPRRTADAIESGCALAQWGAIETMARELPVGAQCLISGGAAAGLAAGLTLPYRLVDNLVLEGLAVMGADRG